MIFFRTLSTILFLWGVVELLMGIAGLFKYNVGTSHSLYIGIGCLVSGLIIRIVCKIVKKLGKNKYID